MTSSHSHIDIRWRRGRLFVRFFGSLILSATAALASFVVMAQTSSMLWLAVGSLLFLLLTIRAVIMLIASGKPAIRLDDAGFESPLLTKGRIDWRDVDDIIVAKRRRTPYLDVAVAEGLSHESDGAFF